MENIYNQLNFIGRVISIKDNSEKQNQIFVLLSVPKRKDNKITYTETDTIPLTLFGSTAKFVREYIVVGQLVMVKAELGTQQRSYESNGKTGTVTSLYVNVTQLRALESKEQVISRKDFQGEFVNTGWDFELGVEDGL